MSWVAIATTVVSVAGSAYAASQSGSGSGEYEAPKPSLTENTLMEEQLGTIRQAKQTYEKLDPLILQSMGLVAEGGTPGHYETKELRDADNDRIMQQVWVPGTVGNYRKMTQDEILAAMSPTEKGAYDILGLQQERQIKALKGELPVSPALEAEIEKQKTGLVENLAGRLGPNWQTTTAGIQTMSEFNKNASLLREEARRSEIAQGAGQTLAGQEAQQGAALGKQAQYNTYGQQLFPLLGAQSAAQQPYQYYSGLQNQANAANATASAQQQAGLMSGLGSLAGAGISAYGTYQGLQAQQQTPYYGGNTMPISGGPGGAGLLGSY